MRKSRPLIVLTVALALAGCGGLGVHAYSRTQAFAIVAGCMKKAGATRVLRRAGDQGTASFAAAGSIEWGYVMSGSQVASVFASGSMGAGQAKLNACLKPHGWSVGS